MKQLSRSLNAIRPLEGSTMHELVATCSFCPASASVWVYVPGEIDGVAVVDGVSACASHATARPLSWDDGGLN